MTRSGLTARRRRCWRLSRAGWGPSRWAWCVRPGLRTVSWLSYRSSRSRVCRSVMRGRCWMRCSPGRSMCRCASRSSPKRGVTRWRCWSCRAWRGPRIWRAGSGCSAHWRGGSRTASASVSMPCPRRRGGCCCWRRPIRPAIRCWCGGPRGGSGSVPRPRHRRRREGWPSSAPGSGSGIRWCARRSTGRRRPRTDKRCTGPWPTALIRRLTRIAKPGTGRRPRPGRMGTWPPSWSGRRAGRRPAAGWPPRRLSWSARRC
jgi:hypothetical protein